jgi:hypothetical protein
MSVGHIAIWCGLPTLQEVDRANLGWRAAAERVILSERTITAIFRKPSELTTDRRRHRPERLPARTSVHRSPKACGGLKLGSLGKPLLGFLPQSSSASCPVYYRDRILSFIRQTFRWKPVSAVLPALRPERVTPTAA